MLGFKAVRLHCVMLLSAKCGLSAVSGPKEKVIDSARKAQGSLLGVDAYLACWSKNKSPLVRTMAKEQYAQRYTA